MDFFTQLFLHPSGWYHAHQLLVGQMGVNGLLALSIWLTLYSGQLTLANAGFMAIGAFTSVILTGGTTYAGHAASAFTVPYVPAIVAGMVLAGVVAFVIGLPVLRLKGVYLAIATIGFGEALRFGLFLNLGITGKGQGLNNTHAAPGNSGIIPIWLSVAVLAYVGWRLMGSKLGHAWAAIREDELAAASQGVNVAAYKMVAFVAGALIAAYAGALDAHLNFFVDPNGYGFSQATAILIFAVVGGISIVIGPIAGAILLTTIPEAFRFAKDYRDVVNGVILIAVVIFRPQGLIARRGLRNLAGGSSRLALARRRGGGEGGAGAPPPVPPASVPPVPPVPPASV
jgi:branched-chain amino acid transport system permease protein